MALVLSKVNHRAHRENILFKRLTAMLVPLLCVLDYYYLFSLW